MAVSGACIHGRWDGLGAVGARMSVESPTFVADDVERFLSPLLNWQKADLTLSKAFMLISDILPCEGDS